MLVDPVDDPGAGDVGIGAALDLALEETDGDLRRLVLRVHEPESAGGSRSRHHVSATQSG